MSVILDALRKSEHERQRSAVPGLAQVPTAMPRAELPRWALVVIGVLGVAVLVLGGAWLQSLRGTAQQQPAAPVAAASAPAAAPTAARTESPPPAAINAAPTVAPAPAPAPPTANAAPLPANAAPPAAAATPASRSLADVAAPSARTSLPATAPATDGAAAAAPPAPAAAATSEPTLPSAAALMARGVSLPPLKLELHAYAPEPRARFVFINGRKYAEGQRLAEGPEVTAIAPNGAVLTYLGQRFLLAPE